MSAGEATSEPGDQEGGAVGNDRRTALQYSDAYFAAYKNDCRRGVWYRAEHDRIVKLKPEGGTILDVGCGLGQFLATFDSTRWQRYGVDVSDVAMAAARARGITVKDYECGYDYPAETFDVIVFRGTIQHLETPFSIIKTCMGLLNPNGLMAFLSTPNANSICYKLFGTLPALDARLNYLIPSDTMLRNALRNFGLNVIEIRYPYLETPYARPARDHLYFVLRCLGANVKFPFWRNMMEIYAVKPRNCKSTGTD